MKENKHESCLPQLHVSALSIPCPELFCPLNRKESFPFVGVLIDNNIRGQNDRYKRAGLARKTTTKQLHNQVQLQAVQDIMA